MHLVLIVFLVIFSTCCGNDNPYTWKCQAHPETIGGHTHASRCIKLLLSDQDDEQVDMNACKLSCGRYGALWPLPTGNVNISSDLLTFLPDQMTLVLDQKKASDKVASMFDDLRDIFRQYLYQTHPLYDPGTKANPFPEFKGNAKVVALVSVETDADTPTLDVDESYGLHADENNEVLLVKINAKTYFGARHGVETLSQLIDYNELTNNLQINKWADIVDKPEYPHRGVLMDTSRNYFSIPVLKRMVDALSYNKMNVMHWHIVDTHSFPLVLDSLPELAQYGAYSKYKTYSVKQVRDLVEYGRVRGVKILPEFDAPAHVGNGWQYVQDKHPEWGNLAVCINQEEWQDFCVEPPCGQFNIVNDKMYAVLGQVYNEMMDMFDTDIFHMGGDEVNFNCWNQSQEIKDYLAQKAETGTKEELLKLWGDFQSRAYDRVIQANKQVKIPAIIWTNSLTEDGVEKHLNKEDYIIQFWSKTDDKQILDIINKGYKTIYSPWDKYYLDCGYSSWVGEGNNWCSPYKGWQEIYDTSPRQAYMEFKEANEANLQSILGGEACMWSEQVEGEAVEGKVWPRSAALGERLWADPKGNWKTAETRFVHQRERMVKRGIAADAVQPEWCHQNEGLCYTRG